MFHAFFGSLELFHVSIALEIILHNSHFSSEWFSRSMAFWHELGEFHSNSIAHYFQYVIFLLINFPFFLFVCVFLGIVDRISVHKGKKSFERWVEHGTTERATE